MRHQFEIRDKQIVRDAMIGLQDEMKQSDDRGDTTPLDKQMERDAMTGLTVKNTNDDYDSLPPSSPPSLVSSTTESSSSSSSECDIKEDEDEDEVSDHTEVDIMFE